MKNLKFIIALLCLQAISFAVTVKANNPDGSVDNPPSNTHKVNLNKERQQVINEIAHNAINVTLMVLRQQEDEAKKDLAVANRNEQEAIANLNRITARLKALIAESDKMHQPTALHGNKPLKQDLAVGCIIQVAVDGKTKTVNVCK